MLLDWTQMAEAVQDRIMQHAKALGRQACDSIARPRQMLRAVRTLSLIYP